MDVLSKEKYDKLVQQRRQACSKYNAKNKTYRKEYYESHKEEILMKQKLIREKKKLIKE